MRFMSKNVLETRQTRKLCKPKQVGISDFVCARVQMFIILVGCRKSVSHLFTEETAEGINVYYLSDQAIYSIEVQHFFFF